MTNNTADALSIGKISGDSHISEPRGLWSENLPKAMREQAMRGIEAGDDGGWAPIFAGTAGAAALKEDMKRLRVLDPDHRLGVMREEGIAGECVFPTIGLYVWMLEDPEGGKLSCRIYNEFMADGLARSPRFKCGGLVPTWTVEDAIAELDYIVHAGLGSFMLPTFARPGPGWNHRQWKPLWSAIEEAGLPVVMHQGTGHDMIYHRGPGASVANLMATQSEGARTAALLATSGVLADHPDLHVVFVEYNAGWLAWVMNTIDFYTTSFRRYGTTPAGKPWITPELPEPPSYYLRRQVHATFQDDPVAIHNIGMTGAGCVIWGNDYPHEEGTYPHSPEVVARLSADLDDAAAMKVFRENAATLFQFDAEVLSTPA